MAESMRCRLNVETIEPFLHIPITPSPGVVIVVFQDEIQAELDAEKVFVQGVDKQGRSVMILRTARHSMKCVPTTMPVHASSLAAVLAWAL